MKKKSVGLWAAVGVVFLPAMAMADTAPAAPAAPAAPSLGDVLTSTGIVALGHVSASYDAGFNKGDALAYHAFDANANTFELNQAALSLAYQPTSGFGALVNVIAGSDAKIVNSSYQGSASGNDFALAQGFVQYANGPLTVIAGRYVTLAGAEVIDDSQDANISRSLLFQLAEPLVHTGVRAAYKVTDAWTAFLGVNNSAVAGLSEDTDKQKTVEFGGAYAPSTKFSAAVTDYYGVDGPASGPSTKDNYLDGVVTWQATDKLQLVGNFDYLRFLSSTADGYAVGFAGYANYQFTDSWKGSLRGEYLSTKNTLACVTTDCKSDIEDVTLTVGYVAAKNFTILGEFRDDISGKKIFPNPTTDLDPSGNPLGAENQAEISIKGVFTFGNPPPSS
jgi:hypothetical protein